MALEVAFVALAAAILALVGALIALVALVAAGGRSSAPGAFEAHQQAVQAAICRAGCP